MRLRRDRHGHRCRRDADNKCDQQASHDVLRFLLSSPRPHHYHGICHFKIAKAAKADDGIEGGTRMRTLAIEIALIAVTSAAAEIPSV
jgi:hypothetical protein